MKRLILVLAISSSAFGHTIEFNEPKLLEATHGDAQSAQKLSKFCLTQGKTPIDCVAMIEGSGNLKLEAALGCFEKFSKTQVTYRFDDGRVEIPGSRSHQLEGTSWHTHYETGGDTKRSHRHSYSDLQKKRASEAYKQELITQAILAKTGFEGTKSKTDSQTMGGGIDFGVTAPITLTINFSSSGENSTERALALLTQSAQIPKTFLQPPTLVPIPSAFGGLKSKRATLRLDSGLHKPPQRPS